MQAPGQAAEVQDGLSGIGQQLDRMTMQEQNFAGSIQGMPPPPHGEELSYYALDITSVSDLIQQQNLLQYQNSLI